MNILIIYAHPSHQSFNAAILKQIQNNLNSQHHLKVLDLYAEKFDPVLIFDDQHRRRDLDKVAEMEAYRQLISWADHLIFIFPIWWSGMPAILKGFIDRVFASGFAYSYKGKGMVGHLKGKTAWIISTHNTPSFFLPFVQDYGIVLKRQILGMCGIKPCKRTSLPYLRASSAKQRQKMLEKIAKRARDI
ncbi:NAD(P)H-dependent oxidoreductase [Streptococcus macacae]|uniref:Flavin reductase n=1 Tax=Streptococcus macacae NCTC 11558 TaxID=764298 RepID=G5JVK7_9STRE|nr:NAD(P)H-dependent oxidoreductase [Streptococcus macacae]EHJ52937.1 flavin reductase [Streptococcus macacae NCTC 11558]SUN78676.1 NAD(P)H dehydrogenase [Streptococcus macacae NCTC 11558]